MNPLDVQTIQQSLENLEGWSYEDDQLRKQYQFCDFSEALAFIVRVGLEAEKESHHPELKNVYNRVEIRLNTHDVGDKVTEKDLRLAGKIDKILR
ncbi:MAG: 4a-hydroxytetrahydrobiopterin dehydratase [Balneolaceae bacterium]|nr:4a-hydroxytetrahydrobiopterin dehydratase [Bacteroidota bacterium]